MILLEYFGKSRGSQSWYGPVTGKQYSFGLDNHKIQPVDPKDLQTNSNNSPGLLEIRESGVQIFKEAKNQGGAKAQVPVIPAAKESPPTAENVAFQELLEGAGTEEIAKIVLENPKVLDISLAAKKLADEMEITLDDVIKYIIGTGKNGKVTVRDIREYTIA